MGLFGRALILTAIAFPAITAVAEAGVSVAPDRHIIELTPGQTRTVEYQVHNSGPQELDIEIDPQDWSGLGMNIYSWLYLEESTFKVGPAETKPFKVTVTAPDNIDGEIVAMLFLCYKEDPESILNIRNGIPLYLVIKDSQKYSARIESVNVGYVEERPNDLTIMVKVNNEGNMHIAPGIAVSITDIRGKELKNFLLKKAKILLRTREQTYTFGWRSPSLPNGTYTVKASLSYEDKIEAVEGTGYFDMKAGRLITPAGGIVPEGKTEE